MGNSIYDRLDGVLERVVHDADYWVEAIDEAAKILGGHSGLLVPMTPSFRGCWLKASSCLLQAVEEYIAKEWHLNDYRQSVISILEQNGYATDDDIVPVREARCNIPFYADFAFKHNVGFFIATRVLTSSGLWCLSVYFDNDHPPITDEQIEHTKELSKRFELATKNADEIVFNKIFDFAQFFNNTNTELHLFDPLGDHCFKINNQGKISEEAHVRPSYISDSLSNELYEELSEICTSDPAIALSKSHQVRVENRHLNLLAIQVPIALRHYHMIFKVCVIATECADDVQLKKTNFMEQYHLTEAEVTTLELLSMGNSVNSIAELLSLKPTSIRQRLKSIYEKVNVNSQVELIALFYQN